MNLLHGQESLFGEVAGIGGGEMPWKIEKRDDKYCVIKETDDSTVKCHDTESEAKDHLKALYASEHKGLFSVYKSTDGSYRWASISSVAVKDKEFEIVTEKAYDDAIEHAKSVSDFGELDLVHVSGTDVGDCDFMARSGNQLLEGGSFYDTPLAQGAIKALNDNPDHWGVSIKFVYDPSKFDGEKYQGNIRILKRSILPQEMAASFGTKLVALNGGVSMEEKMNDKTRDALEMLNVPEEKIESLAEKQTAPEPNTVEKEAEKPKAVESEEDVDIEKSVWKRLKEVVLTIVNGTTAEPDAETGGEEEDEVEPVEAQDETEKETGVGFTADDVQKLAEAISMPLIEKMKESEERYAAKVASLEARLTEAEQAVEDKVISKLVELPRVVRVRASEVESTVADQSPQGMTLPQPKSGSDNYVAELMKGVTAAVTQGINDALPKAKI